MEELKVERRDAIEVITLNQPDKLNALSFAMVLELGERLEDLQYDDEVRAVVLTGGGRAFCAGADLSGTGGREDSATALGMRISTKGYSRVAQSVWSLEKPVIAAVGGVAAGAGCNLALACDLLVASTEASFIQVFARRGLVADMGGTYFLPRLIGLAKAKELMFSGRTVHAEEALELGLVNRVVAPDELMNVALALAAQFAEGPTRAIGMMKRMLNLSFESSLESALEREASLQGVAVSTKDAVEGFTAFYEKRPPKFEGK